MTSTLGILDVASRDVWTVLTAPDGLVILAARWSPDDRGLVPLDTFANNPDRHPTQDLIVFSAPAEGGEPDGPKSDLWTERPDGSGPTRITNVAATGGTAIDPTFTPDGSSVLFVLHDAASSAFDAMATMGLEGTGLAPATASGFTPGTQPRRRPTP